jgi:hypothetical protein
VVNRKPMKKVTERASRGIQVGSRVVYHMPWGTMTAVVVEDRGNNGWKGARIVAIRPLLLGIDDADPFEVPLDELTLAE